MPVGFLDVLEDVPGEHDCVRGGSTSDPLGIGQKSESGGATRVLLSRTYGRKVYCLDSSSAERITEL